MCVLFHRETSRLIWTANQMTGFYMKCNTGFKWVKVSLLLNPFKINIPII